MHPAFGVKHIAKRAETRGEGCSFGNSVANLLFSRCWRYLHPRTCLQVSVKCLTDSRANAIAGGKLSHLASIKSTFDPKRTWDISDPDAC